MYEEIILAANRLGEAIAMHQANIEQLRLMWADHVVIQNQLQAINMAHRQLAQAINETQATNEDGPDNSAQNN